METYNKNTAPQTESEKEFRGGEPNRSGRIFGGLIVVFVGAVLMSRAAGVYVPYWLISWPMLLIAIGTYVGFRHSFRGLAWAILILIGAVFLAKDVYRFTDYADFIWPTVIILIGIAIMFRPKGRNRNRERWRNWDMEHQSSLDSSDDRLDSTVIFGAVKKKVISKTFRGGEAVTVFGGTEINLMQADVEGGRIVLDLTQVFGGTKLIVPPHWKIQSEDVVAILGGIEDKRPILSDASAVDSGKILVLKGTCIFGGIDIKSY